MMRAVRSFAIKALKLYGPIINRENKTFFMFYFHFDNINIKFPPLRDDYCQFVKFKVKVDQKSFSKVFYFAYINRS